jgi:CubicO group peptidase (beta-lactamase class C family)
MTDTTFNLDEKRLPEVCDQYLYSKEKGFENIGKNIRSYKLGSEYESGGAGAVSTVNDYIKFLEGIRLGKVISPDTIEKMTVDHLTDEQRAVCWVEKGYGYGLGIRTPDKTDKRTDFGWNGAAGAYGAVDLKNEITLYYSQSVLASPARPLQSSYIEAAKLDLGFSAYEEEMWKEKLDPLTGVY